MALDRFLVADGGFEVSMGVLVGVTGMRATFEDRFCKAERELSRSITTGARRGVDDSKRTLAVLHFERPSWMMLRRLRCRQRRHSSKLANP